MLYKVTNKTNQVIQLINFGYLYGYKFIIVNEITPQIKNLEKRGLVSIRKS
jgi:hypothetical protein